ncbi:HNH endonuclease [Leclercia adecarboxylata]|uniref:HNH endonuclease n=1 Tax=Leclercia adecarboxylata TaxID=83655 RepID=A0ABU6IAQ7_9ENTR|nr:HNH endonuclease [Leclercia adecarboxylata]EIU2223833.1 HNH endonuclease [Salmonella enterica]EKN0851212.1 HNH endonuclease [Salmonella enterica]MEC3905297.1 HNH endonuclease [Leclercia adecarboxylata]MEC3938671.1 HNH endonuclease [Leclercia adecarboxylata]UFM70430.1 HNH endonuclease [Leclercia adecarboxylata]
MTDSLIDSGHTHVGAKALRPACSVDGCGLPARANNTPYCEKHYMRVRRHGSTDKLSTLKPGNLTHSGGYVLVNAPTHPLSRNSNRAYEHRVVYHQHHGDGPFSCHWCGIMVTWDDMHVDHLDDCKTNNAESNLVASCALCNQKRGSEKMKATHRNKSHRRYTAHGKTMCLSEWAEYLGISRNSIEYRLKAGWDINKVFSPRIGNSGPPSKKLARSVHDNIK